MASPKARYFAVPHPCEEGYKVAARATFVNSNKIKVIGSAPMKVFPTFEEANRVATQLNQNQGKVLK